MLAASQLQLQSALGDEEEDDEPRTSSGDEVDKAARPIDEDWAVAEANADELPALSANTLTDEASPLTTADELSALGVPSGGSSASSLEPLSGCPPADSSPYAQER